MAENTKFSPTSLMHIALLLGTQEGADLYPNDPYWAVQLYPVFKNKSCLPEDWRIKQYYSMLATDKKQKIKNAANGRTLVGAELEKELQYYLNQENVLKGFDIRNLALELIAMGVGGDFRCCDLIAKNIKDVSICILPKKKGKKVKGQPNATDLKRAIVNAAKKVGKILFSNSMDIEQTSMMTEEDVTEEYNVELQLGHDIPDYMTLTDMIDYENEIDDEDECNEYDI